MSKGSSLVSKGQPTTLSALTSPNICTALTIAPPYSMDLTELLTIIATLQQNIQILQQEVKELKDNRPFKTWRQVA